VQSHTGETSFFRDGRGPAIFRPDGCRARIAMQPLCHRQMTAPLLRGDGCVTTILASHRAFPLVLAGMKCAPCCVQGRATCLWYDPVSPGTVKWTAGTFTEAKGMTMIRTTARRWVLPLVLAAAAAAPAGGALAATGRFHANRTGGGGATTTHTCKGMGTNRTSSYRTNTTRTHPGVHRAGK
jgi:hypothetical protein